jgi:pimeloyl-ACP methyl ester carboxylesterase
MRRLTIWLGIALLLAGCAEGLDTRTKAARIAASAGLNRMDIPAGMFDLVAYARFGASPVLRVYIEGDGHPWTRPDTPSADPSPWTPVALELAALDPSLSVAYLARPCQFGTPGKDRSCGVYYWTDGRYAEPVIASLNAAIDRLLAASGADSLELIGFSGGGALAAIIAARRHDVANLRTVAANLDTADWTARQRLSPLTGSLNPADFADRLQGLPQTHFSGAADSVVDIAVTRAFAGRFARMDCVNIDIVQGAGHADGWQSVWPSLLRRPVRCASP